MYSQSHETRIGNGLKNSTEEAKTMVRVHGYENRNQIQARSGWQLLNQAVSISAST
jgi:hypothetical protein